MADIRTITSPLISRAGRSADAGSTAPAGLRPTSRGGRADEAGADSGRQIARQPASLSSLAREALGSADLPSRIDLVSALEAARGFAPLADRAVPGLGRLVAAVIDDESRKLTRSLDLAGQ